MKQDTAVTGNVSVILLLNHGKFRGSQQVLPVEQPSLCQRRSLHCFSYRSRFSHLLSPLPNPQTDPCAPEGPHSSPTTNRRGLQDPLWNMHEGVHRPDRPHLGAPAEGAQEGTCVGSEQPICSSRACNGRDARYRLDGSHSCGRSPSSPPEVFPGGLAHPFPGQHNEQGRWHLPQTLSRMSS